MAENSPRTSREPLSERVRRVDAVEEAERREAVLYQGGIEQYEASPGLSRLHSHLPWSRVREGLEAGKDEALESVETDRAAFREAMVEYFESSWRLQQALLRLFFFFAVGGVITVIALLLAKQLTFAPLSLNRSLGVAFFVLGAIVFGLREPMSDLLGMLRKRRFAELDLEAAEKLLERAIRDVALPAQLRRLHQAGAEGETEWEWNSRPSSSIEASPGREDSPDHSVAIAGPPIERPQRPPNRRLEPLEAQNLVELYQSPQQIPTEARNRLKTLVAALGGASLGIAGPRGIGKTSLLQWFFDHQTLESDHLAVRIAAPPLRSAACSERR